jgi:hypothetical protein
LVLFGAAAPLAGLAACGDEDDDGEAEQVGQSCNSVDDCYPDVRDREALEGELACLSEQVENGYCTHRCETDADCCAVPGECRTGLRQVCSPIENQKQKYCFLSCETADMTAAEEAGYDAVDELAYCQAYAASSMSCRSSGGGSENRKVCLP